MNNENLEILQKLKTQIKESQKYYTGIVKGTRSRYGFLNVEGNKDIFIPPYEMDKVFPGDKVRILVKNDSETTVESVLETTFNSSIGIFTEDEAGAYVMPEDFGFNRKIRIPKSCKKHAKDNSYVRFEIIEHPFSHKKPKAKIVEVIGEVNMPGIEVEYVTVKNNVRKKFPSSMKTEIEKISKNQEELFKDRKDLTDLNFVTIDGETSLDLDDAIFVDKVEDVWKLYVAIADVSSYVKHNSVIDKEAFKRVSTAYFSGKVIPMLPSEISQELCSLLEGQKRLAFISEIDISEQGEILKYNFYEAVVKSKAKMSYNEVEDFINGQEEFFIDKYGDLSKNVMDLFNLHKILNKNRSINNIIQNYNEEFKLILDLNKKIKDIIKIEYKTSNRIVEECMVAANIAAAQFIKKNSKKGIFKSLYGVNQIKEKNLKAFLVRYIDNFSEDMLDSVEGFKTIIECLDMLDPSGRFKKILMTSLNKSEYSEEPLKHFGLGFEEYTTFTSPIRRYPDLIVHRIIKDILAGGNFNHKRKNIVEHFNEVLKNLQVSNREVDKLLKAEYVQQFIGNSYLGTISIVNRYGITVKLKENGIEGFIPISELVQSSEDIAIFDDIEYSIDTENEKYSLNDELSIKIKSVNSNTHNILFELDKQ